MDFGILIQAIINGIMVGGIYALVGMSLNMIFGVMKIVNFCQGEMLMVSMYVTYLLYEYLGLDPFIAIPIVAVVMFLFGALIQTTLITRSIKEDGDQNVLFLTCCLGIFLSNVALMLFTSDYKTADSMFANQVVTVAGMNISVPRTGWIFHSVCCHSACIPYAEVYKAWKTYPRNISECDRCSGYRY